jgi:hypothetical protein
VPTHPDRAGGLGFLSNIVYAFTPLLLAQGALYAGMLANRILFLAAKLTAFKIDLALVGAVLLFVVLGPLLVFIPQLAWAKRTGLREYGVLAQRYVREFDHKWLRGGAAADESLVGSGDIQSLADLGNSFEVIRTMRVVPFTKETIVQRGHDTGAGAAPDTHHGLRGGAAGAAARRGVLRWHRPTMGARTFSEQGYRVNHCNEVTKPRQPKRTGVIRLAMVLLTLLAAGCAAYRLRSYAGQCGFEPPARFEEAGTAHPGSLRRLRNAEVVQGYLDGKRLYIHLVDGGIADNSACGARWTT